MLYVSIDFIGPGGSISKLAAKHLENVIGIHSVKGATGNYY
jgi:hypothetical protein